MEQKNTTAKMEQKSTIATESKNIVTILNKDVKLTAPLQNVCNIIARREVTKFEYRVCADGILSKTVKRAWESIGVNPLVIAAFNMQYGREQILALLDESIKTDTCTRLKLESFDAIYTQDGDVHKFWANIDVTTKFAGKGGLETLFTEILALSAKGVTAKQFAKVAHDIFEASKSIEE